MLDAVVRITSAGDFIGTGFLASVPSEEHHDIRWGYVVTAHHVVARQIEVEVHAPNPTRPGELYEPVTPPEWTQPLGGVDVAVAAWDAQGRVHPALGIEYMIPTEVVAGLRLGSTIFYAGIFEPLMRPILRSGTLAAVDQRAIPHLDYEQRLHLVDCRSYKGFSGSPCLVQFSFAKLVPDTNFPWDGLPPDTLSGGKDIPPVSGLATFSLLCGMFARHFDYSEETRADGAASRYGVGVMVRSNEIRDALMTPELREQRRQWDEGLTQSRQFARGDLDEADNG